MAFGYRWCVNLTHPLQNLPYDKLLLQHSYFVSNVVKSGLSLELRILLMLLMSNVLKVTRII